MSVLSKLIDYNKTYATPYNCYELGHVWEPSCTANAIDMTSEIFLKCCGLYLPLFALNHILTVKKYDMNSIGQSGLNVIRSSAFIANHVLTFFTLFCGSRHLLGKFYFTLHAFPITFLISYLSLPIEKKSRRGPLALYVLNVGSECLLRMLVDKGVLPNIPHAPVILFTATMTLLLYVIKCEGYGSDPASFVLRLVLGSYEAKKKLSKRQQKELESKAAQGKDDRKKIMSSEEVQALTVGQFGHKRPSTVDINFNELIPSALKPKILQELGKHSSCRHRESCLEYAVFGFLKPLVGAWVGSSALNVVKTAAMNPSLIQKDPWQIVSSFFDPKAMRFGLFMGSFAGIYKAVNCYLRHRYNGSKEWHAAVGGLLAGPSMFLCPHSTISLYFFWKLVEIYFVKSVRNGYITKPDRIISLVYALSVSQIAYCVLLQPKYMRPSYMKLADFVSGHRFHLPNRCFCTFLVPEAIEGYEDYFADLDPQFCTRKFVETVLPWALESKEYCRRGQMWFQEMDGSSFSLFFQSSSLLYLHPALLTLFSLLPNPSPFLTYVACTI